MPQPTLAAPRDVIAKWAALPTGPRTRWRKKAALFFARPRFRQHEMWRPYHPPKPDDDRDEFVADKVWHLLTRMLHFREKPEDERIILLAEAVAELRIACIPEREADAELVSELVLDWPSTDPAMNAKLALPFEC